MMLFFNRLPVALSGRDQRLILLALPVVLLLVGLLIWQSLADSQREAERRLNRSLEDTAWLQSQSRFVATGGLRCPKPMWQSRQLEGQARRYGINLEQPPELSAGRLALDIASGEGNRVIEFVQMLECQGAVIQSLSLMSGDDTGAVRGQLVALLP